MNKIIFLGLLIAISVSSCRKPISGEEYIEEHVSAICDCMSPMIEADKMGKEVGMTTERYLEYMKAFESSTQKVNTCFAEKVKPIVEKIYAASQKQNIAGADLQTEVTKYNTLLGEKLKSKCPEGYQLISVVDKSVFEWREK